MIPFHEEGTEPPVQTAYVKTSGQLYKKFFRRWSSITQHKPKKKRLKEATNGDPNPRTNRSSLVLAPADVTWQITRFKAAGHPDEFSPGRPLLTAISLDPNILCDSLRRAQREAVSQSHVMIHKSPVSHQKNFTSFVFTSAEAWPGFTGVFPKMTPCGHNCSCNSRDRVVPRSLFSLEKILKEGERLTNLP